MSQVVASFFDYFTYGGFGQASTHTPDAQNRFANMPLRALEMPLSHPADINQDDAADAYTFKRHNTIPFFARALGKVKRMLS